MAIPVDLHSQYRVGSKLFRHNRWNSDGLTQSGRPFVCIFLLSALTKTAAIAIAIKVAIETVIFIFQILLI